MTGLQGAGVKGAKFSVDPREFPDLVNRVLEICDATVTQGTIFLAAEIDGRGGPQKKTWFHEREVRPVAKSPHAHRVASGLAALHAKKHESKHAPTPAPTPEPKRTPMTPTDRLSTLAHQIATDQKITLSAALKLAGAQLPEAATAWRATMGDGPEASAAPTLSATAETGTAFDLLAQHYATEHRVDLRTAVHKVGVLYPALAKSR